MGKSSIGRAFFLFSALLSLSLALEVMRMISCIDPVCRDRYTSFQK